MGTLYVVGIPAGSASDLTLRARRILDSVSLVAADSAVGARRVFDHLGIAPPPIVHPSACAILPELAGGDVALLVEEKTSFPTEKGTGLIQAAIHDGHPVVPVPGPSLPVTALVLSGLPADSFVYLGRLPGTPVELGALLQPLAAERQTLVAMCPPDRPSETLLLLSEALGPRPLVIVAVEADGTRVLWRGSLEEASDLRPDPEILELCVLVIGGARQETSRWEEGRMREELARCLGEGMGTKEASRALAAASGWPRREIYRLAIDVAQDA